MIPGENYATKEHLTPTKLSKHLIIQSDKCREDARTLSYETKRARDEKISFYIA